jgi:hypothetical protein
MAEGIYNKYHKARGTLIGNWYEERSLRDFTGVGRYFGNLVIDLYRTIVKEHIPKKHLNFEEPIRTDKKFDNTHDRIHGHRRDELMYSENYHYGKNKNPADELP